MDTQKEREAFEDWYIHNMDTSGDFEKISEQDSPYMDDHVNNSWLAWQAAKAESHKSASLYQWEINHLAAANQQWKDCAAKAQAVPENKKFNLDEFLVMEQKLKSKGGIIKADLDRFIAYAEMVLEKAKALKEPK